LQQHQGTFTGGICSVARGTKRASFGRAIADNVSKSAIRLQARPCLKSSLNAQLWNVEQFTVQWGCRHEGRRQVPVPIL
jgi:hypothetical protein